MPRSRSRRLLLASVVAATPVAAQPPAPAPDAAASSDDAIVVTGSRIARPDFAAPNPIVSFGAADIRQSGNTNVTTFLQRVPALTNSVDSSQTAGQARTNSGTYGSAGLNLLDLRGLGPARTLVLVNGRRHVAGQVNTAAVDISSIPTDLIERVDVLTGGASAVYGADGVSGVVNFVMKHDFEGVSARSQIGISRYGDGGDRFASVLAGHNFAGGRGNVTLSYEYNADDAVTTNDRSYLRQNRRRYVIANDAYAGPGSGTTQRILQGDLRYPGESPYGAIDVNGDFVPDFRGDGQVYDPGTFTGGYATGGVSTGAAGFTGDLLPRIRRHSANLFTHFDFSDAAVLSLEGKFVQTTAATASNPSGNYPATLSIDNPFMPASIRAAAIAAGVTTVQSTRDNLDFPMIAESDRRRTYRGVVDLAGRISDHARYDLYYTYGRTDVRIAKTGDRWSDRMTAALDVVTDPAIGRPTCRSNLDPAAAAGAISFTPRAGSGCVPLNTFGRYTATPAALAFVLNPDNRSSASVTQQVVDGSLTGDFGQLFTLPGGPIAFAAGGEYRRETSRFSPNGFLTAKQWYQYDEGNPFDPSFVISPSRGHFDVWELFGELNAPILKDVPFAHTLSVGAAGRYSHYSTIGATRAWQFNGVYAPVEALSFRGSYGKAVRAPNIGELFQPISGTSAFIDDPCYVENRGRGAATRAANCAALVQAAGGTLAGFTAANNPDSRSLISGSQQGNRDLTEETARTWTAGVVLRPRFVPGLSISADWYDIRIAGAISTPDAQTVSELCVDQSTVDNVYCAAIARRQGTGYISGFVVQPQNVARFRTAGLDINIGYRHATARLGTFDLRFVGGYLNRLETTQTPGAAIENQVDQPRRPRFNFNAAPSWTLGRVTLAYNLRWYDRTRRYRRTDTDGNPDYVPRDLFRYHALWQHDVQASIDLDRGVSFYGGVTNLTNQRPDEDATNLPISPLGRFLYVGARVRLAGR